MTRAINDAGLAFIKKFEALRLSPYQDEGGLWSIGYWHRCAESTAPITIEQAEALLNGDLVDPKNAVGSILVPLNDNQF